MTHRPLSEYNNSELEQRKTDILGNMDEAQHTKQKVRIPDMQARILAIDNELSSRATTGTL